MKIFKEITGQGEPLVVIHGGAASFLDMMPIVNQLSPRYQVININLPGTGESTWDMSIQSIHDIADHVVAAMPKQAIYLGWSFGGLVAQSIAARYPHRVKRLIGVATTPKFIAAENWPGFPAPGFSVIVKELHQAGKGTPDFIKMLYEAEFSPIHPKPVDYQAVEKLWLRPSSTQNNILARVAALCDATDLRDLFKTITCPIDLIMGTQDTNVPQEAFVAIKKLNHIANIHEINGAQHAPFWTHPEVFTVLLDKIL